MSRLAYYRFVMSGILVLIAALVNVPREHGIYTVILIIV